MSDGFLTDLKSAMLFFRICQRYKIDDVQGRKSILGRLAKKQKVKYLRNVEEALDGKKALYVRKRK